MNPWWVLVINIAYLMIGAFVVTLLASVGINKKHFGWGMAFWPVIILFWLIAAIFAIPITLAEWITERIGK